MGGPFSFLAVECVVVSNKKGAAMMVAPFSV
jgi:hypothetical protein